DGIRDFHVTGVQTCALPIFRYQATAGEGFGRYIGLATIQQDAMADAAGNIDALGGWAAYVGLRHVFTPSLRGNIFYARSQWDNRSEERRVGKECRPRRRPTI